MTHREAKAFAPASVANLGLGFDILGLALERPGDTVTARISAEPGVRLVEITGDGGRLPRNEKNTAAIAAAAVLETAGCSDSGVDIILDKGLPIASGLGSSAASAVAAAVAVNHALGRPLRRRDLLSACLTAEERVSGRHADNAAASLLGGVVLVRSVDPVDCIRLPVPSGLSVAVVIPELELPTKEARLALPEKVDMKQFVANTANLAALVSALHGNDPGLIARCLPDQVVTPARERLIPGCRMVMEAALDTGALASSISGAGPSMFALAATPVVAREAGSAMVDAFEANGIRSRMVVSSVDSSGAGPI